jgi:carbon monoxide dehydrogenase subunit G
MMDVSTGTDIDVGLEHSWELLHDVELVASCVPGARLTGGPDADGDYPGRLDVHFGPARASFSGRAALAYDEAMHTVGIRARGQDSRGRTRAVLDITVAASAPSAGRTHIEVTGTIDVVGALERFASTGGAYLADQLMLDFAANLARHLGEDESTVEALEGGNGSASVGHAEQPHGGFGTSAWTGAQGVSGPADPAGAGSTTSSGEPRVSRAGTAASLRLAPMLLAMVRRWLRRS